MRAAYRVRAPLLEPSPLRTGRDSFPSSGSSTSKRLLAETRFGNRKTQAMNPVMALGMKQNAVLGTGRTTHYPGNAMVKAPPGETIDFGVAYRTEASLFKPEKAKKMGAPKRVPHMIRFAFLPSSRRPLLASSPLRTGRESLPSSGSSTRLRPQGKRGRSHVQKANTTYAILRSGRFTLPRGSEGSCTSGWHRRHLLCSLHRFHN